MRRQNQHSPHPLTQMGLCGLLHSLHPLDDGDGDDDGGGYGDGAPFRDGGAESGNLNGNDHHDDDDHDDDACGKHPHEDGPLCRHIPSRESRLDVKNP
eukprot:TRINITY_DN828_c1_g4_i1.p2 TRINITY_DN828_c1_g4~~TRINITY_DN828_c1_g4_i1.p2  ORF type:complete len:111 (+),score=42.76 TRINITY_DN828_c1_g4_i1:42-335(+)